jgi:hypothetical protein
MTAGMLCFGRYANGRIVSPRYITPVKDVVAFDFPFDACLISMLNFAER